MTDQQEALVTLVYALDDVLEGGVVQKVHEIHELGRFARNMSRGGSMWFQGRKLGVRLTNGRLMCPEHGIFNAPTVGAWLYSSQYGCVQLAVKTHFSHVDVPTLTTFLRCTSHERDTIKIDEGTSLLEVIDLIEPNPIARFGLDVHAIVSIPRADSVFSYSDLIKIVYRDSVREPDLTVPVASPLELNRFTGQVGIHGRGVTVLVGHDDHTVAACTLVVEGLLMLIQQIRSLESRAQNLLVEATAISSIPRDQEKEVNRIARIATLAGEVQRLDVLVSIEVESVFANGSLPEIVLDSYRDSLANILGIRVAIDATSRTLTKVREFISAEFDRMRMTIGR